MGDPIAPTRRTLTDRSGTIATGGTAQTLMAVNAQRNGMFFQNQSAENLFINWTTAAVATGQPSYRVAPGDTLFLEDTMISTEAMSVIGASTGSAFCCKEW